MALYQHSNIFLGEEIGPQRCTIRRDIITVHVSPTEPKWIQMAVYAGILLYGIYNSIHSGSVEEKSFAMITIVYVDCK